VKTGWNDPYLQHNRKNFVILSVGNSSARCCRNTRKGLAVLAIPGFESISHNPEVVGSNPAPATRRKDLVSQDTKSFFVSFSVFAVDGSIRIKTEQDGAFWSAFRRRGTPLSLPLVSAPSVQTTNHADDRIIIAEMLFSLKDVTCCIIV